MTKRDKIINWSLAIIFLSVIVFAIYSYFGKHILYFLVKGDTTKALELIYNTPGAVFIFILLVALEVIVAPIPALILYILGGVMFGTLLGSTYSLIGNILGAGLAFLFARNWGRDYFEKRVYIKMKKRFDNFSLKHGPLAIFFLRLNPFTSSDIFSYIAGLSKMKFWKFLLGTALGLAPLIYAQTYIGNSLSGDPLLMKIFMWVGVLYVLIFTAIFIYSSMIKNNKEKK